LYYLFDQSLEDTYSNIFSFTKIIHLEYSRLWYLGYGIHAITFGIIF